jgi:hypothetical protein
MSYIFTAWFNVVGGEVAFDHNLVGVFAPDVVATTYNFAYALSSFSTIKTLSSANASFRNTGGTLFFN